MNLILISSKCIYQEDDNFYFRTTARQTDHLRNILKVEINQKVKVGVINKGKGDGIIVKKDKSHYVIQLVAPIHLEAAESNFVSIDVVLCLPRPKILDKLLQQLSSIGVKRIVLVFSDYSNKCYESSRILKNEEIKHSLQLGLEQAVCTAFPEVYVHYSFNSFFMNFEKYADDNTLKLCAHTDAKSKNSLIQSSILNKEEGKILLMIGCERGFSDLEIYLLKKLNFQFFYLNNRILKCETAVLIVLGQLLLLTENTSLRPSGSKMRRHSKGKNREMMKQIRSDSNDDKKEIANDTNGFIDLEEQKMENKLKKIKDVLKNEEFYSEQLKNCLIDYIDNYKNYVNENATFEKKRVCLINLLLNKLKTFNKNGYNDKENKADDANVSSQDDFFHNIYISLLLKQIKYERHLQLSYGNLDDIIDEDGVYIYKSKKYVTKKSEELGS